MSFDVYLMKPACSNCEDKPRSVYDFNLTHNVNEIVDRAIKAYEYTMGEVIGKRDGAGYQKRSWGRLEGWTASDAVPVLECALSTMRSDERRAEFLALQPDNGWGTLDITIEVTEKFLQACRDNPTAVIETSG